MMVRNLPSIGALALLMTSTPLHAEPTTELMVQEAAGLLHHSCDSLVEVTGADEDAIVSVVKKMVAVSLINRQVDLAEYATTDERREELRAEFIEQVRGGCAADRKALLAGIIDTAVKNVLGL
ncbi:hypothetical protein [Tateyamaria pelophila]|uniref:hypothetical protein n=1 Tax=Tateyamaria pelophila TaxID=328415 RepID=UPI001CBF8E8A|nr:hypothetical protein [Tateyamaria pelophila]